MLSPNSVSGVQSHLALDTEYLCVLDLCVFMCVHSCAYGACLLVGCLFICVCVCLVCVLYVWEFLAVCENYFCCECVCGFVYVLNFVHVFLWLSNCIYTRCIRVWYCLCVCISVCVYIFKHVSPCLHVQMDNLFVFVWAASVKWNWPNALHPYCNYHIDLRKGQERDKKRATGRGKGGVEEERRGEKKEIKWKKDRKREGREKERKSKRSKQVQKER